MKVGNVFRRDFDSFPLVARDITSQCLLEVASFGWRYFDECFVDGSLRDVLRKLRLTSIDGRLSFVATAGTQGDCQSDDEDAPHWSAFEITTGSVPWPPVSVPCGSRVQLEYFFRTP